MKATQALHYRDLLAVPYRECGDDPATGLDCWGQCRELRRRLGMRTPDVDRIAAGKETADECLRLVRRSLAGPLELGDILVSMPAGRPHVATVVDGPRRLALSVQAGGGAYLRPARYIEHFLGVYRAGVSG